MARSARLYVPLDAAFLDDDRVIEAGERATYLYVAILCRVKLLESDGLISRAQVSRLGISGWQRRVADLLRVGLLLDTDGSGYLIPSWSKWNELSRDRADRLARDRERKRSDSRRNPEGFQADSTRKQASKESKQAATPSPPSVDNVLAHQRRVTAS